VECGPETAIMEIEVARFPAATSFM
jgi:hypothetical protein